MENTLQSDELIIKEKQLDAENDARSCEEQFKAEQLKEQVKDRYFKAGIAAAEIIIPIVFYSVWLKKGFKFEEKVYLHRQHLEVYGVNLSRGSN